MSPQPRRQAEDTLAIGLGALPHARRTGGLGVGTAVVSAAASAEAALGGTGAPCDLVVVAVAAGKGDELVKRLKADLGARG